MIYIDIVYKNYVYILTNRAMTVQSKGDLRVF